MVAAAAARGRRRGRRPHLHAAAVPPARDRAALRAGPCCCVRSVRAVVSVIGYRARAALARRTAAARDRSRAALARRSVRRSVGRSVGRGLSRRAAPRARAARGRTDVPPSHVASQSPPLDELLVLGSSSSRVRRLLVRRARVMRSSSSSREWAVRPQDVVAVARAACRCPRVRSWVRPTHTPLPTDATTCGGVLSRRQVVAQDVAATCAALRLAVSALAVVVPADLASEELQVREGESETTREGRERARRRRRRRRWESGETRRRRGWESDETTTTMTTTRDDTTTTSGGDDERRHDDTTTTSGDGATAHRKTRGAAAKNGARASGLPGAPSGGSRERQGGWWVERRRCVAARHLLNERGDPWLRARSLASSRDSLA